MKKHIYKFLYVGILAMGFASCDLDTEPTDKLPQEQLLSDIGGVEAILNGVYRSFYKTDWSEGYPTENFGPSSVALAGDLMAQDDMQLREFGNYWFAYDFLRWTRTEINNKSDRPYVWWNMFYQFVNNANVMIASLDKIETSEVKKQKNLKAQALSLRAYAYFNLVSLYQLTYKGHESSPGVPIYTEPTSIETKGNGRGTVEQVYKRINDDLKDAIQLFEEAGLTQSHKSHIDKYVAYGIKARVALIQEDWAAASSAAQEAMKKDGLGLMGNDDLLNGFNSITNKEWMWGSEIFESQATGWYSFFNHMDAAAGGHAATCRKIISSALYDAIDDNDTRKKWFTAPTGMTPDEEDEDANLKPEDVSYNQLKFRVKSIGTWNSDYIYMRMAEMYLIAAEAECRQGNEHFSKAKSLLKEVVSYKYEDPSEYENKVDGLQESNNITLTEENTTSTTLLDEILLQRRIELWGEGVRLLDYRRYVDPENWELTMMIPMTEFDGNESLNIATDQNP